MKTLTLLLVFAVVFSITAFGQTNETDPSFYSWKKGKTEPQLGYVVLKSDKKLEGMLSLEGSPGHVEEIVFVDGNGKEIKFPPAALKAYGLTITAKAKDGSTVTQTMLNESPEALYEWRNKGETMGKVITNTKPRNGYVVLMDGTQVEGELQLKKQDGKFHEVVIKNAAGKQKFKPANVARYGLSLTIAELTNNGEKVKKDPHLNFHEGTLFMKNGEEKKGWIAFKKHTLVNSSKSSMGRKYNHILYASSRDANVTTIKNEDVSKISRMLPTGEAKYQNLENWFVPEGAMDQADYKDETREFQQGALTLTDGSTLEGEIAQQKNGRFYSRSVMFRDQSGNLAKYGPDKVESFYQVVQGQKKEMIKVRTVFVEQEYKGKTFVMYRNPFPTSVSKFWSGMAATATDIGTSQAAAAAARSDEKKNDYDSNLDSLLKVASKEELIEMRDAYVALGGYESYDEAIEHSKNESYKTQLQSMEMAIAGKEVSSQVRVMKKEWIIKNTKNGEEQMITKSDFKKQMEVLLMGCYTYLSLDKKDQKQYHDFKLLKATLEMLDECY